MAIAGCGSASVAELPPPAGPARDTAQVAPGRVAVLDGRARTLSVGDETVPAGVGPTRVVGDGRNIIWVLDTAGNAVLQFHQQPRLELTRRVRVAGRPDAIAFDRARNVLTVRTRARTVRLNAARGLRTLAP